MDALGKIANVITNIVEETVVFYGCDRPSERTLEKLVRKEIARLYPFEDFDLEDVFEACMRTTLARIPHRLDFEA